MTSHPTKRYVEAGTILRDLIRDITLTNSAFALRWGVPPKTCDSYLRGWSAPRAIDEKVWSDLAGILGADGAARYRIAVERVRSPEPTRDRERQVRDLIRRGRFDDARRILQDAPSLDEVRVPTVLEVARSCFDRGMTDYGEVLYEHAVQRLREERSEEVVPTTDELASRLMSVEEYARGAAVCESELARGPSVGRLWRRLGIVRWYANDLVPAYAALSTALGLGISRPRVVHARGQVLAELGDWAGAKADLSLAIDHPITVRSQAYARSTRAYALFMDGGEAEGLAEFDAAQSVTPDNAWLYWFRGKAFQSSGDLEAAQTDFESSLTKTMPVLNRSKREYAVAFLGDLL